MSVPAGESPSANRAGWMHWFMLALGTLIYFCFGIVTTTVAVLVIPIRNDLGLSYAQMGLILGSWQLIYVFSSIPLGLLVDRIGTKYALFIGTIIMAISAIARGYATDFFTLLAAVGLFGLGGPIISIGLPKLIFTWFEDRYQRGMAVGIYVLGPAAGGTAALALTNSVIIGWVGTWRGIYITYGLITLAVAILWLLLGKERTAMGDVQVSTPGVRPSVAPLSWRKPAWTMLGVRTVRLVAITGFLGFAVLHGFNNWLPHLLETNGYSSVDAGYLAAIPRVTGMFGGIVAAHLAALTGSRFRVIALYLLIIFAGLLAVGLITAALPLGIVIGLLGLTARAIMPLMMTVMMDLPQVTSRSLGVATGIYFAVAEIGGFTGPALIGTLYEATGFFFVGLAALAFLGALTLLPLSALRRLEPAALEPSLAAANRGGSAEARHN